MIGLRKFVDIIKKTIWNSLSNLVNIMNAIQKIWIDFWKKEPNIMYIMYFIDITSIFRYLLLFSGFDHCGALCFMV